MENLVVCVVGLLILAFFFIAVMSHEKEVRYLNELYSELVRHTGLTHTPPAASLLLGLLGSTRTGFTGGYRGRHLSLAIGAYSVGHGAEFAGIGVETKVTLQVKNSARFSLIIRKSGFLDKVFTASHVSSGNEDLDRRFSLQGQPQEFVQRAIRLIVETDPTWSGPPIELKGSDLICVWQNGGPKDVNDQIALLNLLCDLAELTEEMGSEGVSPVT